MNPPHSSRLARWYHLLRQHRADQIWRRAKKLLWGKFWSPALSKAGAALAASARVRDDLTALRTLGLRRSVRIPKSPTDLAQPVFSFLGEARSFTWPIDWRCVTVTPVFQLWRFQLHSQDALWPLANGNFELLWRHATDWTTAHEHPTRATIEDGWHSFCISRRLANWLQWWALSPPAEAQRELILKSAARQAAYLADHLEWDLRGNPLLFNLWALGLSAAFFEGALGDRCLVMIDAHLADQMDEQLTEEGEHFERATAYHIEIAELFLDLRETLRPLRARLSAQCGSIAARMTDLVVGISHPDGDPPLFGDSTLQVRPILDDLQRTSGNSLDSPSSRQATARLWGDYWVWRQGDDCLIFDTGPVGADELPAHAHCDLLGFEASIGGHKLFVDSGVSSDEDDEARRYCRSTAAHNCLEIDGISQCEVWSKFRMGHRGHSLLLDEGHRNGIWWCQASHDAYRRIGIPVVARHFECRDDGTWACMDVLWGSGVHELVSRLHLHPDVQVMQLTSPEVMLRVGDKSIKIVFEGAEGVLTKASGRYCPEFGRVVPITVLEFRRKTKVPAVVKWTLSRVWDGSIGPSSEAIQEPSVSPIRLHSGRGH